MKAKVHHLTLAGIPLCGWPMRYAKDGEQWVCCGHNTGAAARAATKRLRARQQMRVRVVPGKCPRDKPRPSPRRDEEHRS